MQLQFPWPPYLTLVYWFPMESLRGTSSLLMDEETETGAGGNLLWFPVPELPRAEQGLSVSWLERGPAMPEGKVSFDIAFLTQVEMLS